MSRTHSGNQRRRSDKSVWKIETKTPPRAATMERFNVSFIFIKLPA
jgi:hypothetical protein